MAVNSGPTLVSNRPKDTPFSAALKLTKVRYPVSLPALSAVESQISSPCAELSVKGVPGLFAFNWFSQKTIKPPGDSNVLAGMRYFLRADFVLPMNQPP